MSNYIVWFSPQVTLECSPKCPSFKAAQNNTWWLHDTCMIPCEGILDFTRTWRLWQRTQKQNFRKKYRWIGAQNQSYTLLARLTFCLCVSFEKSYMQDAMLVVLNCVPIHVSPIVSRAEFRSGLINASDSGLVSHTATLDGTCNLSSPILASENLPVNQCSSFSEFFSCKSFYMEKLDWARAMVQSFPAFAISFIRSKIVYT